jgi:hypothetical protein
MFRKLWNSDRGFAQVIEPGVSLDPPPEVLAAFAAPHEQPKPVIEPAAESSRHGGTILLRQLLDVPVPKEMIELRSELVSACVDLNERAASFLGRAHLHWKTKLIAENDELNEKCRAQLSVCEGLAIEVGSLQANLENASAQRRHENFQVQTAVESMPPEDSWPTDSAIAAAKLRIAAARVKLAAAQQGADKALAKLNAKIEKLTAARKLMAELAIEEKRTRGQLSGKPSRDPEFGLMA